MLNVGRVWAKQSRERLAYENMDTLNYNGTLRVPAAKIPSKLGRIYISIYIARARARVP